MARLMAMAHGPAALASKPPVVGCSHAPGVNPESVMLVDAESAPVIATFKGTKLLDHVSVIAPLVPGTQVVAIVSVLVVDEVPFQIFIDFQMLPFGVQAPEVAAVVDCR